MLGLAQIEAADSTDEQVGHDKIEESPQDINRSAQHRGYTCQQKFAHFAASDRAPRRLALILNV